MRDSDLDVDEIEKLKCQSHLNINISLLDFTFIRLCKICHQ